jgi:hypothetical protein
MSLFIIGNIFQNKVGNNKCKCIHKKHHLMNIEIGIFWGSLFEPLVLLRLSTFKETFEISMKTLSK